MGFLVLAILSSCMISIMMRVSAGKTGKNLSVLAGNYLVCCLLGIAYGGADIAVFSLPGFSATVWLGLISGILYLASLLCFQRNTKKHGVVLSSVFMKLGLLVPFILSVTLFRETPTAVQIAGFFIALFAIVLINWEKGSKGFGVGLILMLLLNGGADVMAKFFNMYGVGAEETYLLITFGTAFVLCTALAIFKKERPGLKELLYGGLIGVPNFFSSKFFLGALEEIPAVVAYPSFNVAAMLIVTLTGVLVFRERLRKLQWFALTAIIAALALLNI